MNKGIAQNVAFVKNRGRHNIERLDSAAQAIFKYAPNGAEGDGMNSG